MALLLRCAGLLLALAMALPAAAGDRFEATVTHVPDGDTLWVRPAAGGPPLQVRLLGLDAPEICQPHGRAARDALAARVLRRRVLVSAQSRDSYGRLLAQVETQSQDLGRWLVLQGHAWSYRFRSDDGPYRVQQAQARQARRGLWAGAAPVEPRAFRKTQGACETR